MTLPPSGKPARRRAPRVAAALLAILTAIATPGIPAHAGAATPTPTPTPPIAAGTTAFTLTPISNGVVGRGEALAVSLTLQNETASATAPATATVSLGRAPLADRSALKTWLAGDTAGVRTEAVATASLDSVPAGEAKVTPARVDADDPALSGLEPGVYPLLATYPSASGTVSATSAMVVPATGSDEVGIGVLVPITAGPLTEGLLTADQLTALTAPGGALTAQLDGVEGTPAILAVDPAIPAAIRVLGTAAPATATEWLDRLASLPNSRFALQFGDADVAAQLESGLSAPLVPTSLAAYMNPEDFAAEPTPDPQPTATPTPTPTEAEPEDDSTAPVFPTLPALLDIGPNTRGGIFWSVAGTAGPEVVEQLSRVRVDDQAATTVVSSSSTSAGAAGETVPANNVAGEAPVLVYDADVSAALAEASGREASSLRGAALAEASAYLAFATSETGGAPLLVTLGRNADRSRVAIGATIGSVTDAPGVVPFTLGGLINSAVGDVELGEASDQAVRADVTSGLLEEEGEIARFATILDDPSLLTGPERAEILQLLGSGWLRDDTGWTAAVVDHRAQTQTTLTSVGLVPSAPINLYGANVGLRFWVRNDLPYPVNLVLYVTPDNLRLDVQRANPLVAQAASNSRVEVPVQARVGSGDVTLELQLRSRASVAIGSPESVDVTVQAEWESLGLAVLAVVIGGLLLLGVVRTVLRLRGRRRRRADASAGDDSPTESQPTRPPESGADS